MLIYQQKKWGVCGLVSVLQLLYDINPQNVSIFNRKAVIEISKLINEKYKGTIIEKEILQFNRQFNNKKHTFNYKNLDEIISLMEQDLTMDNPIGLAVSTLVMEYILLLYCDKYNFSYKKDIVNQPLFPGTPNCLSKYKQSIIGITNIHDDSNIPITHWLYVNANGVPVTHSLSGDRAYKNLIDKYFTNAVFVFTIKKNQIVRKNSLSLF